MERKYKGQSLFTFPDDYTVIDIETNGLAPQICDIIEVSAIKFKNNRRIGEFSTLIKPNHYINWYITKLTGITNKMVENAPDAQEMLEKFYFFVGDDIVIGHNVNFDVNFLYDKILKYNCRLFTNSFVDTLRLARKALPQLPNHKQTTVAQYFGISTDGAHRALKDCEICNACYQRLKTILLTNNKVL